MNKIFNKALPFINNNILQPTKSYLSKPIGKITVFNTFIYVFWNARDVSQNFLRKHFSFQRFNIKENRLYTALTYSFSHLSFFHLAINMAALQVIGKNIEKKYGNRYVWALYLLGALGGSIAMNYLMPYDTIQLPKVGADPCISAFFSFIAVQNPLLTVFNFIIPVKLWFLLLCGTFFVMVSDSSFKTMGGLSAGIILGLLKKRLLI